MGAPLLAGRAVDPGNGQAGLAHEDGHLPPMVGLVDDQDLERLPEDILTVRGFWRNKVTRILLVVVFTNLGSTLGTAVAIPMMVKVLQ